MTRKDKSKSKFQLIHRMNGVKELACEHGVGHPIKGPPSTNRWEIHGCDGCCGKALWKKEKEYVLGLLNSKMRAGGKYELC